MADEPKKEEEAPVVAAPAAEAAAPAVVVEAAPAAPAAEPVVEAAPAVEPEKPAQAELPLAQPERTPSLLETAEAPGEKKEEPEKTPGPEKVAEAEKKAEEPSKTEEKTPGPEKAEEPKKEAEAPKAEEKPAEPPKPEPIEYKYELPSDIVMDDARRGEFHGALDGFRADPTAGAQKLLDLHHKALVEYAEHTNKEQHRVFNETKKGWRDQVQADEMIGGAGHRTAMGTIAMVRNMVVSDHAQGTPGYKKDLQDFVNALDATGAGDNPHILKAFYRMARYLNEPAAPQVIDTKPVPNAGKRAGSDALYDNDRSPGRQ